MSSREAEHSTKAACIGVFDVGAYSSVQVKERKNKVSRLWFSLHVCCVERMRVHIV